MKPTTTAILLLVLICSVSYSQDERIFPRCVDLSLNGMKFCDSVSVSSVLGTNIRVARNQNAPSDGAADAGVEIRFLNADATELLTIHGNGSYSYFRYAVSNLKQTPNAIQRLKRVKAFVTGKRIHLGISRRNLLNILGKGYTVTSGDGFLVYRYVVDDHPSVVQVFGYPEYSGTYKFRHDKLVEFSFGFSE